MPKADMPKTTTGAGSAQFVSSQKPDQFLASKFNGTDVVGSDDQKVGDVSDILFDKDGQDRSLRGQRRRVPRHGRQGRGDGTECVPGHSGRSELANQSFAQAEDHA